MAGNKLTDSVLKLLSCAFPLLQEVPEQHKGAWAKAHVDVLRRWKTAKTKREMIRALSWLGFLSQGLLRKTTRGGKVGRAQIEQIAIQDALEENLEVY